MTRTIRSVLANLAWLLVVVATFWAGPVRGQVYGDPVPKLRDFYQKLVEHYDPSAVPTEGQAMAVTMPVIGLPRADISDALPSIFAALAHPDDRVKMDACAALGAISIRPDSAALLRTYVKPIGDLLASPNERLQRVGVAILSFLKPSPPPEAAAPMLAFLKRTDADQRVQGGAVGFMVRYAPDSPENVEAVLDFLDRPLGGEARIQSLIALGTPQVKNPNIIDRVIASLDDRDPAIRFTAADVVPRMGRNTLLLAQPKLERLAADPNEAGNVRDEARKALDQIHRPTK